MHPAILLRIPWVLHQEHVQRPGTIARQHVSVSPFIRELNHSRMGVYRVQWQSKHFRHLSGGIYQIREDSTCTFVQAIPSFSTG